MQNHDKRRLWTFVSEALQLNPNDDCSQLEFDFESRQSSGSAKVVTDTTKP